MPDFGVLDAEDAFGVLRVFQALPIPSPRCLPLRLGHFQRLSLALGVVQWLLFLFWFGFVVLSLFC